MCACQSNWFRQQAKRSFFLQPPFSSLFTFFLNFWRFIWRSDEPNRLWLRRHRLIWLLVSAHYNKFQHAVRSSCKRLSDCFWLIAWVHCVQAARDARGRVVAAEGEHRASRALRHAAEVTCWWRWTGREKYKDVGMGLLFRSLETTPYDQLTPWQCCV